jgi:hypothetical protein
VLFSEFVVDLAAQRFRFEKKHTALASTRRAYRAHEVPDDAITQRAAISAGPYEGIFDFAVANGEVVQLVRCWSFQLPNQVELAEQVKARAWLVRGMREHSGSMRFGERDVAVPGHEVEVAAVFAPPAEDQDDAHAFDEARAAFDETGVLALPREEADTVGEHAAQRLQVVA